VTNDDDSGVPSQFILTAAIPCLLAAGQVGGDQTSYSSENGLGEAAKTSSSFRSSSTPGHPISSTRSESSGMSPSRPDLVTDSSAATLAL
jgi:hypothetical protein